jgi:hypothetical protein
VQRRRKFGNREAAGYHETEPIGRANQERQMPFTEETVFRNQKMTYTRLYSDQQGESHFEDVEINLAMTDYAPPAPPLELSSFTTAKQFGFMKAPAGWSSDWHLTPARNIFIVVSGEWEVTASDGETQRFGAGSVLLVEDTSGKGHSSRVVGEADSLAAMVELVD